ncbi:hypothetical protein NUM3379_39230 [Kineococcus sp. NUM-3379]
MAGTVLRGSPWPLTGRAEVLERTVAALRRRDCGAVVLTGPEGVGRSRLAAEALAGAQAAGLAVRRAGGSAAAVGLPFAALADLLPPDLPHAASPFELMRLTAQRLRAAAPRHGLVLAVDDAHLVDDASAALLAHTVRSGAARVLLVVREEVPDALLPLLKDVPCERIAVEPLRREDVAVLCAAVLGAPVEGATLHRLAQLAAGNLLHLTALLDSWLAAGALTEEGGVWVASGAPPSGGHLRQVVERRFGRLDAAQRAVVELTALAGTVEVSFLERVVDVGAVLAVERAGLLLLAEDGRRLRARLPHPLFEEVLREGTPRLAARLLRRRLAAELERTGCRRGDDLLRLATVRLDAGHVPGEEVLLAGARTAARRFDTVRAVRLATAAAEATGSFPARLAAAEALYAGGRGREAEEVLRDLAENAGDPGSLAGVALLRAANLVSAFGRSADAAALVRTAATGLGPGELRDELTALGAMIALSCGRAAQALDDVAPLLARPATCERARVRALLVAVPAWGQVGRGDTAAAVAAATLAAAVPAVDAAADAAATVDAVAGEDPARELPAVFEAVLVGLCYAHGVTGRLAAAEELASVRYAAALERRAPDLRTLWALALGQADALRGDLVGAAAHLREAALLLRHDQSVFGVYSLAWCLGCLADVAAEGGDAAGARAALDEADAVTPEPCFVPPRELARIWVAWAEGSVDAAAEVAADVATAARGLGVEAVEALALHQAARLGRPREVVERLAQLAGRVDGELVPAHAAHAAALHASDAAALAAASREYERLGMWLDAAEAAGQAALVAARAGSRAEALRQAQRGSTLAARCAGARTPGLSLGVGPQPLTAREREVAALAARGWTSVRIAESLVVSARTVDNHLHRAYGKLGVSSRQELAQFLGPVP